MFERLCLCIALWSVALSCCAQNTGGVFPPFVNSGFKSLQYRVAVDPESAMGEASVAQRLHYMQAINDDLQAVVFVGSRQTATSDFDFDYVHAGLFVDLGEDGEKYRTGIRFDVRLRDGSRPNHIGVNWMNQYYFENGWTARAVLLTSVQLGNRANNGLNLQTRWQLGKRLQSGQGVGLEMFSFFGSTDNLGSFNSQNHSAGPTFTQPLGSEWAVFGGVLFGLSDAAPDSQYRLWISRSL